MESISQNNTSFDEKPIITVNEARKILGKDAEGLSDQAVAEQIRCLAILAKRMLSDGLAKKPQPRENK